MLNERYHVHKMCTAIWRQLSAPFKMAPITAFSAVYITAFTTSKSNETKRHFIVRLTSFNLLDLRLSSDCEKLNRIF